MRHQRWSRSRTRLRMSASHLGDRDRGDPDRRAARRPRPPAGSVPSPGDRSSSMSHIGRCSSAYEAGRPGTGSGNHTQSLFGNRLRSVSRLGLVGEVQRAEAPPRHRSRRDRLRGLRAERPVGHVGHQVQPQRRNPRHPRVLDAGVPDAALPALVGLEHDPAPLHAHRHAVREHDLGEPDARHVARRDEPRQQVQPPVRRRGRTPGSARPRPRCGSPCSGDITTPARASARTGTSPPSSLDRRADLRGRRSAAGTAMNSATRARPARRRRRGSRRTGSPRAPETVLM